MTRYDRQVVLPEVGVAGQKKLADAKVLVVGAGGLGCPALQYLAAAGVGVLGVVDFDMVEESNLQRQILFGTSSLALNKANAAKARLLEINPTIEVQAYAEKLTAKNAASLLANYDIVVDGTDNFTARYLINDASILTNTPLVYGAIYKFEGQVAVFNYQGSASYRCLFPVPPKDVPNCAEIGVLGVLPGIIGTMQANEVLKIILGLGEILTNKVACYNALSGEVTTLTLKPNPNLKINLKNKETLTNHQEAPISKKPLDIIDDEKVSVISLAEVLTKLTKPITDSTAESVAEPTTKPLVFIDVRELDEEPTIPSSIKKNFNILQIPLSKLNLCSNLKTVEELGELATLKENSEKVIFCQSGMRAKKAAVLIKEITGGSSPIYVLSVGAAVLFKKEV